MDGGIATVSYAQALAQVAKDNRGIAILSVPITDEESSTPEVNITAYRATLNLGNNADSAALYSTHGFTADRYNGNVLVAAPPDGVAAAVHAISNDIQPWSAPAGTRRGGIPWVKPSVSSCKIATFSAPNWFWSCTR